MSAKTILDIGLNCEGFIITGNDNDAKCRSFGAVLRKQRHRVFDIAIEVEEEVLKLQVRLTPVGIRQGVAHYMLRNITLS